MIKRGEEDCGVIQTNKMSTNSVAVDWYYKIIHSWLDKIIHSWLELLGF